jgi:predicted lysophospholipase L1 biosynthesis ABC-type transport system permease subunit
VLSEQPFAFRFRWSPVLVAIGASFVCALLAVASPVRTLSRTEITALLRSV